ncbi:hypothetical protein Y032_0012g1738 [Ancylostoma ceylanicum]|uniref:Uncharacterized protein n=1 Tax=Ancylostoma ceylanicum TaxID=53326 RepID=A0A016TPR9_9BILA|nr:hypothetical protein Y032_0086g1960 [Ancylostoma ceylanicum]EYC25161.1 hypothetical protein Y032_0012g1738 [Ancylostoma ceylanicum]
MWSTASCVAITGDCSDAAAIVVGTSLQPPGLAIGSRQFCPIADDCDKGAYRLSVESFTGVGNRHRQIRDARCYTPHGV